MIMEQIKAIIKTKAPMALLNFITYSKPMKEFFNKKRAPPFIGFIELSLQILFVSYGGNILVGI